MAEHSKKNCGAENAVNLPSVDQLGAFDNLNCPGVDVDTSNIDLAALQRDLLSLPNLDDPNFEQKVGDYATARQKKQTA